MFSRIHSYNRTVIPAIASGFVLLLSLSFTACSDKTIDQEKFIDVYVDMRIAEDTVKSDNYDVKKLNEEILKKHGITEEQFNATFKYLNENPELWEEFYNEAIARVDTLKKKMK